jgi:exosortase/archaeosortase family protein
MIGVILVLAAAISAYFLYRKSSPNAQAEKTNLDTFQLSLGALLLLMVILYNLLAFDEIGSFDIGMVIAGIIIILLNIGVLSFLKLTKKSISFISYFLFITMVLYGFLFSGLPFLLGDKDNNHLFGYITQAVAFFSSLALNVIQPTEYMGNIVNFNGFRVYIGDACSGIESISIFFSSAIAYLISIQSKEYKKMAIYLIAGGIILALLNILRVMSIILAGYYIGMDAFHLMHLHLGWIYFVIGMGFFWYLLINNFDSGTEEL